VAVEVRATPLANKIIEELPRRSRRAYDQFEADLAARGCAALAYRLSGDLLDHLCVVHLIGAMRLSSPSSPPRWRTWSQSATTTTADRRLMSTSSYTRRPGTSLPIGPGGTSRRAATPRLASRLWIPGRWMNCWPACVGSGHRTCARHQVGDAAHNAACPPPCCRSQSARDGLGRKRRAEQARASKWAPQIADCPRRIVSHPLPLPMRSRLSDRAFTVRT